MDETAGSHSMYGICTFTERGSGHPANEDAFAVESHPDDSTYLICALADGQGGRAGGRLAAEVACRKTLEAALSYSPDQLVRPLLWPTILRAADDAVLNASDAGFTTLAAACITESTVCGASSGDSAGFVVNRDDTHLELTGRQLKNPPVGSGAAEFVPFASELTAPWRVLLMSDGVWKYTGWDQLISIVTQKSGQALIDSLQRSARLPGSGEFQDDFTVVAVEDSA